MQKPGGNRKSAEPEIKTARAADPASRICGFVQTRPRAVRTVNRRHWSLRRTSTQTRHSPNVRSTSRKKKGRVDHGPVESMASTVAGRAARKPRPAVRAGACCRSGSVAVLLAAAGPDEGESLAIVLDQVGVDRNGEARIVQLDREIVAALAGALRPGGPDLGAANIDPVARGVVAGPVGLGDNADALGLDAQGDDLALELGAGLLEGADACHVTSPLLFEPATIAASMAICRPKAIDDAPVFGPKRTGGWRRRDFLASRGMGEARGKKVLPRSLRHRRSRRSRPLARSSHQRPRGSPLRRRRGGYRITCTRGQPRRATEKKPWRTDGSATARHDLGH